MAWGTGSQQRGLDGDGTAQAAGPAVGDAYLVARAREDCLDADELLVQRHSAMAYRVALRLTGDHHDAQDVGDRAADFRFWSATALGSSAPRSTQS